MIKKEVIDIQKDRDYYRKNPVPHTSDNKYHKMLEKTNAEAHKEGNKKLEFITQKELKFLDNKKR